MQYNDILTFWFEEIEPSKWWIKDVDFDELIKQKYLSLHKKAHQCELYQWRSSAEGRLAEIIILDQFSRNMFRDSARSFASDALALALAQEAISLELDAELTAIQRSFLYMPFMHSESIMIHDEALQLFTKNGIEQSLKFEIKHRDIIARFGRYPHRNEILHRQSTAEEIEFLKQPGSSF